MDQPNEYLKSLLKQETELTFNQHLVLLAARRISKVNCWATQKEIAALTSLSQSAVSRYLEDFRKAGLVIRTPSPTRTVKYQYKVTQDGLRKLIHTCAVLSKLNLSIDL